VPPVKTEAVCLRRIDYSETSQVLHLYTRDSGKVHAIAKGSKRRRTRFNGPFDVLGRYEIVRLPKPPGQLDLLTESELLDDHAALRRDYGRFAAACYTLDVVETLTVEGAPDRGLFELLAATVLALADGAALEPAILGFECRALRVLGFFPRALQCGSCREPVGEEGYFSCHDGGAICTNCRPHDPGRIRVRRAVLESLSKNGEGAPAELRPILNRYLTFLAERRLRTWISFPRG
jgi:DNA repair protein RecO (recombination protein O)